MRTTLMCLALVAAGCGAGSTAGPAAAAPLTVADWKQMPVEQKYTPDTIDRLKAGDPALESAEGWEAFQKTVIGPSRKKDFPGGKR